MTAPLHLVRRWTAGEPSPLVAPPGLVVRTFAPGDAGSLGRLLYNGFGTSGPDPGHRRRGVGAHLLREAICRLDRLGVYELHLAVDAGNAARELYARAGFRPA
jgi:RimJ/RimL family protein N-acetyltransferase